MIARRRDLTYQPGERSNDWVKLKLERQQEFVIGGHRPDGANGIDSLPVGTFKLTAENTELVVLRVTDGTLLLFPAYLRHSVDVNASTADRISISFNIMFSAFTENLTKPLWSPSSAS